jgi:hypothetical protein
MPLESVELKHGHIHSAANVIPLDRYMRDSLGTNVDALLQIGIHRQLAVPIPGTKTAQQIPRFRPGVLHLSDWATSPLNLPHA